MWGKDAPLPIYERNETTGKMEITGWSEEKKIGVKLEVTPHISPDGHIKLTLKPEVSSFDSWLKIELNDAAPITSTRTVETEVLIKDGQTVVIGGLVKDESVRKVNKIPFLGDLPIVGIYFHPQGVRLNFHPGGKTDLLIFVTARIIKDSDEPLIAYETNLITAPMRPFKMEMREISLLKNNLGAPEHQCRGRPCACPG